MSFSNLIILMIFIGITEVQGGAIEVIKSFDESINVGDVNYLKWKALPSRGESGFDQKFYRNHTDGKKELIFTGNLTEIEVSDAFKERFDINIDRKKYIYSLQVSNASEDIAGHYQLEVKFFVKLNFPLSTMMTNYNIIDFTMGVTEPTVITTTKVYRSSTAGKPTIHALPKSPDSTSHQIPKISDDYTKDAKDNQDFFFTSTIFIAITSSIGGALIITLVVIVVLVCHKKGNRRKPIRKIEHNFKNRNFYIPSRALPTLPRIEKNEFRTGDYLIPFEIEAKSTKHKLQTEEHCHVKITGESYYMIPKNQTNGDINYEEIPLTLDSDQYQNMSSASNDCDYENVWSK